MASKDEKSALSAKIEKHMKMLKSGERMSNGQKIHSRAQAVAISMSEMGLSNRDMRKKRR